MSHLLLNILVSYIAAFSCLHAQSIEEKKQSFNLLPSGDSKEESEIHQLEIIQNELEAIYDQANSYFALQAPLAQYKELASQAQQLHEKQRRLVNLIQQSSAPLKDNEMIWHLPEATIKQLMMEFAGDEVVYVIPDEIGQKKITIVSGLSLPRQLGSSMLELILSQMGVGVRQVNLFCKELFLTAQTPGFDKITDNREDLWLMPDPTRVGFVLKGDGLDMKQFSTTLMRFIDTSTTQLKPIGSYLGIIGPAVRIRQILQIYDFMKRSQNDKAYRIIHLSKLGAVDLQKMLSVIFSQNTENKTELDTVGLQIFPIQYEAKSALFVAGSESEVKRASTLIEELESQSETTAGKQLFWYSARHADVKDLASVVTKIYAMLTQATLQTESAIIESKEPAQQEGNIAPLVVSPVALDRKYADPDADDTSHIVVDAKSGALIMVVEPFLLPKLKELIAKLDTPKKMVRIDFLLFEKKVTDEMQFGLDLLKTGSAASHTHAQGLNYSLNTLTNPGGYAKGILNFFMSRTKSANAPAFDMAYNFLLAQDSIQINANPSILTLNGTASSVNLVDEISVSTGPVEIKDSTSGSSRLKDSYTRAQYGITIKVTPTVHASPDNESDRSITLDTDITFDTPRSMNNDRPLVTRRNIKNLVRIADGETVILGGLRQKDLSDRQDSLPFLGEIPGFGKLFSYTSVIDRTTEMFIFITPHIIDDPKDSLYKLEEIELRKRPGDINEFLHAYYESAQRRQSLVFSRTLRTIFGRLDNVQESLKDKTSQGGAYDGRS